MVCIYTKQHKESIKVANRCVETAKKFGNNIELHPAVYWREMDAVHKQYSLINQFSKLVKLLLQHVPHLEWQMEPLIIYYTDGALKITNQYALLNTILFL